MPETKIAELADYIRAHGADESVASASTVVLGADSVEAETATSDEVLTGEAVDEILGRSDLADDQVHAALFALAFQGGLTSEPDFRAEWFPEQ
jgi:hypothetical protein